jgi:hypothetical protein
MTWLIDMTDRRFMIPVNATIVDHIRRANPFAHSDLGQKLLDLGKALPGAGAYSPSFRACAYVVLHDEADRIFAFAGGMHDLSFRLDRDLTQELVADGTAWPSAIGGDWIEVPVYRLGMTNADDALLARCGRSAREYVRALTSISPPP